MRRLALALVILATPALAGSSKPKEGQFCKKGQEGKAKKDKSGASLTCKDDGKGKLRWTK